MALWRSTIHGTIMDQTVDVIHGWETDLLSPGDRDLLASRIEDVWAAQVMTDLSIDYGTTSVTVVGVDNPTLVGSATSEAFGALDAPGLPASIVAKVQLITGFRGRSFQGRYGMPGLVEYQTQEHNPNFLEPGQRDTFQANAASFKFGVESGTIEAHMRVISTISGGVPRPVPIGTPVIDQLVHSAVGSRNSRKS